ncbi:MAG: hypothetical protein OXN88_06890 [Chloroflexota bacterium]|nr:hypothetical protein [Chloroflexota bacterium]
MIDPAESHNLYGNQDCQPIVDKLNREIDRYFGSYQAPAKSGLRVRELPRHNLTEAWRRDE